MNMSVTPERLHPSVAIDAATLMSEAVSIVKTYLQTATVAPSDLPSLITSVYAAISSPVVGAVSAPEAFDETGLSLSVPSEASSEEQEEPEAPYRFADISRVPVVPVEESVQEDGIVCLIDGTKKLMVKRHIRAISGMEWEDYLAHFGLPSDYPSVAPAYSKEKSVYAKKVGLGSVIDKTPRRLREQEQAIAASGEEATPARRPNRVRRVKMAMSA